MLSDSSFTPPEGALVGVDPDSIITPGRYQVPPSPTAGRSTSDLGNSSRTTEEPPLVRVSLLDDEFNSRANPPSNRIRTAKYTLLTFLPLNICEQFRRASNIFFLCVVIIGLIPGASPFSPLSSIIPLCLVLGISAAKSGYEDHKRHRADAAANAAPARVFRGGDWLEVHSHSVRVGDMIRIENGEEIRADCVLLASSDEDGLAYIETANLDGETSLKTRRALPATQKPFHPELLVDNVLPAFGCKLTAQAPSACLASWKGVLEMDGASYPTGLPQFLPRGSNIRNVEAVIAMVAYTGIDTKMFLNLKPKPHKTSHLERCNNRLIAAIVATHQFLILALCGTSVWWHKRNRFDLPEGSRGLWYLQPFFDEMDKRGGLTYIFFWNYLAYFVLLGFMIPLSLFVGLEIVKAFQAVQMSWDHRMSKYDSISETWRFCRPKTSDLNEELSQARFIFTDKTGTLTENRMNFQQLVSESVGHDEACDPGGLALRIQERLECEDPFEDRLQGLMAALAVCHTILAFPRKEAEDGLLYDGASPDEVALVRAASRNGYVLRARGSQQMTVSLRGQLMELDILAELEFTAERKRMSIIVRLPDRRTVLISKGADASMIPRRDIRDKRTTAMLHDLQSDLVTMSLEGLRTLVFGYRVLSETELTEWLSVFHAAASELGDREAALESAYDVIERDYSLLGATAVEDKLQDGVPETIKFMARAGIVVWMLTGDKRETAVTIAATSGLVDPDVHTVVHFDVTKQFELDLPPEDIWAVLSAEIKQTLENAKQNPNAVVIVVDGITLRYIFEFDSSVFVELGLLCAGAVCCRLTPLQKAECVRLFQSSTACTVLSVGDGANDVSMIQEARVGIGIMGLEGAQAELASDYAIPQFRHLRPLLALHGRYSWYRNSTKIQYSFYKNITLAVMQFSYTFFSGFTGQTMIDAWLLSMFNTFFTVWLPLSIGMFDKDVEEEAALEVPRLYGPLQREQQHFNLPRLAEWAVDLVLHGGFTFGSAYWMMTVDNFSWHSGSMQHAGTAAFCVMLTAICATGCLTVRHWNIIQLGSVLLSAISIPAFVCLYSMVPLWEKSSKMYGIAFDLFGSPCLNLMVIAMLFIVFTTITLARKYIAANELPSTTTKLVTRWRTLQKRRSVP
jgi:phospholipid-transporting ATPase